MADLTVNVELEAQYAEAQKRKREAVEAEDAFLFSPAVKEHRQSESWKLMLDVCDVPKTDRAAVAGFAKERGLTVHAQATRGRTYDDITEVVQFTIKWSLGARSCVLKLMHRRMKHGYGADMLTLKMSDAPEAFELELSHKPDETTTPRMNAWFVDHAALCGDNAMFVRNWTRWIRRDVSIQYLDNLRPRFWFCVAPTRTVEDVPAVASPPAKKKKTAKAKASAQ